MSKDMNTIPELTPELFAAFQAFLQQQKQNEDVEARQNTTKKTTKVKGSVKKNKKTKAYLKEKYNNTTITLTNITDGTVGYQPTNSSYFYKLKEYGDTQELSIEELLGMPQVFLESPWLKIEDDEEIIEALGLEKLYEYMEIFDDLEDIESLDLDYLKEAIDVFTSKRNKDFIHQVATKVQLAIDNGDLVDYRKIQQLGKMLQKDFIMPKE